MKRMELNRRRACHLRLPCLAVLGILIASALHGQDGGTDTLRKTVEEWVGAMQKIQEEQGRWAREKQILESNREGLEQEIADLKEAIASAKGRLETTDREDQDKLARKREYDSARSALAASLTDAEAEAMRVLPLLPAFLLKENTKLGAAADALKKTGEFTEEQQGKDLGKRLGAIVMVLTEAEKFQGRTWIRVEERQVSGRAMLVKTIYFGFSTAFAADEQGTVALRGFPGEEGWEFEAFGESEAPGKVLELISVASLKGEIKFVEIPLELR